MTNQNFHVRLYFIRHAESEANLIGTIICGQSLSSALSPLGNQQAILLGQQSEYENFQFDYLILSTAYSCKKNS